MATTYKIHPAIGIARVGNSPDEFFIGPERIGQRPEPQAVSRMRSAALNDRRRDSASTRITMAAVSKRSPTTKPTSPGP